MLDFGYVGFDHEQAYVGQGGHGGPLCCARGARTRAALALNSRISVTSKSTLGDLSSQKRLEAFEISLGVGLFGPDLRRRGAGRGQVRPGFVEGRVEVAVFELGHDLASGHALAGLHSQVGPGGRCSWRRLRLCAEHGHALGGGGGEPAQGSARQAQGGQERQDHQQGPAAPPPPSVRSWFAPGRAVDTQLELDQVRFGHALFYGGDSLAVGIGRARARGGQRP